MSGAPCSSPPVVPTAAAACQRIAAKHTPGPWHVGGGDIRDAKSYAVALIDPRDKLGERDANARLIAAAPEMYEALQAWMDHRSARMSSDDYSTIPAGRMDEIIRAAESALAKATGEPK
jgi:hypothetical protein